MLCGNLSRLNSTICCSIQEAIARRQGVATSLYRNQPALSLSSLYSTSSSSRTLDRKSMATSPSNAVLGDVYVDDLISSCGSVLDLTNKAGVHFRGTTHRGSLRAIVNLRRLQPLYGPLNFGRSTFDVNWRNRNSGSIHGPCLRNFFTSSSACCLAGAAHDVSFDSSPSDEQLENSSTSPDLYVIVVLCFKLCFCLNCS